MANDTTSTTQRAARRAPTVPCHRLVGAGITALVFFTPIDGLTPDTGEGREPDVEVAGFSVGVRSARDAETAVTTVTSASDGAGTPTAPTAPTIAPSSATSATGSTTTTTPSIATVRRSSDSGTSRITWQVDESAPAVELGPLVSPDVGNTCANGLDSGDMSEFMGGGIDDIDGADYQRAIRLPDDRVLWTFQDAFVGGRLLHNVAAVQSGRCFTRIGPDDRSWLLADDTVHQRRWHWILDGLVSADGTAIELFVVEMHETGDRYLGRTRPTALRRVTVDAATLEFVETVDEPWIEDRLYGWSVTSDADHTYLYSHCYRQFGHDTLLGFDECSSEITVARVDRGDPAGARTYWDGQGWNPEPSSAVPVVDATLFFAGNNPAQIRFTGERFELVEKRGDWFGDAVEFATAPDPFGPFEPAASVAQPLPCSSDTCNSYFATWVPWQSSDGTAIWMISHNRWNGAETADHLEHYRPSVHSIHLPR